MRRLNPDDPADRPLIARNVTSMGVAASLLVLTISLIAIVVARAWHFRLLYGLTAVVSGVSLAYYLWMFREVRRNAAFAASFRYRPRPVVGVENRKFVLFAVSGLAVLVIGTRLFGPRIGVFVVTLIVLVISVLGMLRRKRGE